jgi:hypothetical protein
MEDKKTVNMIDERKVKKIAIWSAIGAAFTGFCVYRFGYRNGALATANSVQQAIIKTLVESPTTNQPTES